MELQHVNVKIFAESAQGVELGKAALVFQRWIQEQSFDDLLIDVADYLHVPAGPGMVLIGRDADYYLDETGHALGLRYSRKTAMAGSNEARFAQALQAALGACQKIEAAPEFNGPLKFNRKKFQLFINDRALAPNTESTWKACQGEIESFVEKSFPGNPMRVTWEPNPRERFGVLVELQKPIELK
jgi:hypothetical protein